MRGNQFRISVRRQGTLVRWDVLDSLSGGSLSTGTERNVTKATEMARKARDELAKRFKPVSSVLT